MTTRDRWIDDFSTELQRREVPDDRIQAEVETVLAHVHEAGGDAERSFGDPVAYAATLAPPASDDTPPQSTVLTLFAVIALFVVYAITVVRWVQGDPDSAVWAVVSGLGLLVAVAALSISLTRRALSAALRDGLNRTTDAQWRASSVLVLLVPWVVIAFAGLVPAVAALR